MTNQLSRPNFEPVATATEAIAERQPVDVLQQTATDETSDKWKKIATRTSLGVLGAGAVATVAFSPLEQITHDVEQVAPWVGGGIIATETLWIGGAALALGSTGRKIGNPLTLHSRFGEVKEAATQSPAFKVGLMMNTVGALGTAGVVALGAASLPAETWPGAAGLVALDVASTVAVRTPIYRAIKKSHAETSGEKSKVTIRRAQLEDIDRLADIDLKLFSKAYGEALPTRESVVEMLTRRYHNTDGKLMFVSEVRGQVEGFVTGFRTNKGLDEFRSWEDSTANGTLDGKVDPKGKYVYVANMTASHESMDMLLANLFADAIRDGVEYGYFESRMPGFKRWLNKYEKSTDDPDVLAELATEYAEARRKDGKRLDSQLRMYEDQGFELQRLAADAFSDDASMNFGAVYKVDAPLYKTLKHLAPVRRLLSAGLRQAAKNPKVLNKVF